MWPPQPDLHDSRDSVLSPHTSMASVLPSRLDWVHLCTRWVCDVVPQVRMLFSACLNSKGKRGFSDTPAFLPSIGVLLPLYHLRGIHHASLQHARCHHRQRPHLLVPHHRAERLPVGNPRGQGTPVLAGECPSQSEAVAFHSPLSSRERRQVTSGYPCCLLSSSCCLSAPWHGLPGSLSPVLLHCPGQSSLSISNNETNIQRLIGDGSAILLISEWWYDFGGKGIC